MTNFFFGKKILVAGSAGFIGVNLVKRLAELGADVRGTIFQRESPLPIAGVEYVKADLRNPNDCLIVTKNIDYVFLAAANSSGAAVMARTPLIHLTPNIVMNSQMLEAAYTNHVKKFCFISSNTVYPLSDDPMAEGDVNNEFFEKYFIVGWMKRFSELMCEIYSTKISSPMETLVIRPGNLYGPYDKFTKKESKVIAALIRRAIDLEAPFKVWGDGFDIKDFLYIDDFIDGMLLAFQKINQFDAINIASGVPISIRDTLSLILESAGYSHAKVEFDSSMPTMIPKRLIDISKAQKELNWEPKIGIDMGLKNTIRWYRDYYSKFTPEQLNDN
jgi:GDP-L-fucose synthase